MQHWQQGGLVQLVLEGKLWWQPTLYDQESEILLLYTIHLNTCLAKHNTG